MTIPTGGPVVLLAPPFDYTSGLYGFVGVRAYRNQPPLGLGYLASALRDAGFPVRLLDAAAEGWDVGRTVNEVLALQPSVVGVSAITLEAPSACTLLRALRPRTKALLVLGGAHANSYWETVPTECPDADVVAVGEGEQTLVELCRAHARGSPVWDIAGSVARRPDGTWSELVERPPEPALDRLAPPAYDLFPHAKYVPLPHRRKRLPATAMITSRGCSYARCTYCEMSNLVRKHYRRHSPARVVREMKDLLALTGAREVYFQDDIFITDPAWVEEFCDRLRAERLDVLWSCESRFVGLSRDLFRRMHDAGCWRIYFGFESGSQESLDAIRKGFTLAQARQAARDARAAGLDVVGFFMLGLPGETPEMGRKTIEFARTLGLNHAIFSLTVPHRNTDLYEICREAGTILRDQDYFSRRASYVPHGYRDAAQLERLRDEAYRRFYLRPAYWWQCLRDLKSMDDVRYYLSGAASLFSFLR